MTHQPVQSTATVSAQAIKLGLIEWLIQLEDVDLLNQLDEFKDQHEPIDYAADLAPPDGVEEWHRRAREANADVAAGRFYNTEQVAARLGLQPRLD